MAAVFDGAVLHGTADAIDIREDYDDEPFAVVVDWKTGQCGGLPPIYDDRQMRAYAYLASEKYGMPAYVMRVQLDTGIVDVLDLRSEDDDADNRITVEAAVAWHVEHHGEPAGGATCTHCPIRTHCRHYCAGVVKAVPELATITNHDGVPVIATDEDARRVAMVLRPARAALDRLEKELRAWVEDRGAVEDTGRARTWGHALRLRDVISDHAALLAELASETDDGRAWSTAATTKTGVLRALMDGGLTTARGARLVGGAARDGADQQEGNGRLGVVR
ncbi:MAG: PD-(D/E)XK nuclease family protein [Proteobacteria bacterium]|nr:PD-(D/E)XK nuclease family protein [Pseudomonadota bacterium]